MRAGRSAIWVLAYGAAAAMTVAHILFATARVSAEPVSPAVAETAPALAERSQLDKRARKLAAEGRLPEALEAARQMLAIEVRILGANHDDVAGSYNMIAVFLERLHQFPEAIDARTKQLNVLTALYGADDWRATNARVAVASLRRKAELTADELGDLVAANKKQLLVYDLFDQSKYADAIAPVRECLAIRRRLLGEEHPLTAKSLNNLGRVFDSLGDYAAARSYYEQALAIRKKVLGEQHPETAASLGNLGGLLASMGDYAAARPYREEALAIRKNIYGDQHRATARSLNDLGLLLEHMGEYAAARPYLEQALAIHRKVLGEEHAHTALSLNSLGSLLMAMGDYAEARLCYEQALAIKIKVLGTDDPSTALSLNNLGTLLGRMGDYAAARPYLEQALAIKITVFGNEHPGTALSLSNLGSLYASMGDYAVARRYYEQALAIEMKALGAEHPDTATSLNNLGYLLQAMGDYAAARPYYERALEIRKKVLGENHPETAMPLQNLAMLSAAEEDWPAAIDGLVETNRIEQISLEKVFATATEARMRAYLETMSGGLDFVLSLPLAKFGREADGLAWVLRRKAIVFEAQCRFRAAQWLAREDPQFAQRQSALVVAQKQLGDVTLRPPAAVAPEELSKRRKSLQAQIAELEDQLQTALAARLGSEWSLMTTVESARAQLPADAALVEIVKYSPFNFQATGKEPSWSAAHYVAFVLHADAQRPVELVELGEAAPIDAAVAALGRHVEGVQRAGEQADWPELEAEYRGLAAPLYEKLFAPIAAKLGGVKRVYLSPDSQLHNLPFEALVDSDGKYLAEEGYTFAYLTSGRDLLRGKADQPGDGAFVFAAPNYDLQHGERFRLAQNRGDQPRGSQAAPPELLASAAPLGTRSADVRGLKWKVLPAMAAEGAEAAEQLANGPYGNVETYSGDAALEERFKSMGHPRLVVLVTHGFYLPDQPADHDGSFGADPTTRSAFAQGKGIARLRAQENPLYRSGVVLAGANTLDDPVPSGVSVEDGWLTAEEISQLDFRGTDLVVLSACNTGRGQVATGDAVAGLRSAFLFAGAQTLVGSLYEVPDRETRELMQTFYAGLRERRGKLESLNAAQLALIERLRAEHGAAHPFFWASFVLVGEP